MPRPKVAAISVVGLTAAELCAIER